MGNELHIKKKLAKNLNCCLKTMVVVVDGCIGLSSVRQWQVVTGGGGG